jgi:hypothetical protein
MLPAHTTQRAWVESQSPIITVKYVKYTKGREARRSVMYTNVEHEMSLCLL